MRGLLSFLNAIRRDTITRTVVFIATSLPEVARKVFLRAWRDFPSADFTVIAPSRYRSLFPDQISFFSNEEIKSKCWGLTRQLRKMRTDSAVAILDGRPIFRLPKLWAFLTNYRSLWVYDENGDRILFHFSSTRRLLKHLWDEIREARSQAVGAVFDERKRSLRGGCRVSIVPNEESSAKVARERKHCSDQRVDSEAPLKTPNSSPAGLAAHSLYEVRKGIVIDGRVSIAKGESPNTGSEGELVSCPMCSCPYTQIIVAKIVQGKIFRVMQCCNMECLHGFLTPSPTLELLASIYGQDQLNDYLTDEATIQANCEFFSHLFEAYIPRAFPQPGTMLDIGAGIGTFVSVAKKFGWRAIGVEFNQQSVLWAAKRFGVQLQQGDFYQLEQYFAPRSVDLITFNHVFEHILDTVSFIPYVTNFLKPNGCILLSVPNILSDDFRKQRALWSYLHVPAHISYFSRFSMDALILQKARGARGHFEKIFQTSFPARTQEEGEGLTSMYRWVCD
jgi:SAM-dependent methyltransferase